RNFNGHIDWWDCSLWIRFVFKFLKPSPKTCELLNRVTVKIYMFKSPDSKKFAPQASQ
ncbi:hypothetical protein LCGC14_2603180, partial [marine sediment metagenome]